MSLYEDVVHPLLQVGRDRKERFIQVCCVCHNWQDYDNRNDESFGSDSLLIAGAIAICFDQLIEAIDRNTKAIKDIADQGNSEMGFNVTLFKERV